MVLCFLSVLSLIFYERLAQSSLVFQIFIAPLGAFSFITAILFNISFYIEYSHAYSWHKSLHNNDRYAQDEAYLNMSDFLKQQNIVTPILISEVGSFNLSVRDGLPIFNPEAIYAKFFVDSSVLKDRSKLSIKKSSADDFYQAGVRYIVDTKGDMEHVIKLNSNANLKMIFKNKIYSVYKFY